MSGKLCQTCNIKKAMIVRPKTQKLICLECFYFAIEEEVHYTIISNQLFKKGEKVAMGASGGKDSTVIAHIMHHLNKKYDYGLELFLLSVDEGIQGYRDDSLETVKLNQKTYDLPLKIISYKDLYGWTMDEVVKQIGLNGNCTFCGIFRRQALDRGAVMLGANKIVTGHNADDMAETVLMNILRGDYQRLGRSVEIMTGRDSDLPRCKPLKYTFEKEIVMYAHHKKLDYFSTECKYSPNAYRGNVRELIKNLEKIRPSSIIDIIHSGEQMTVNQKVVKAQVKNKCSRCGYMTSQELCQACVLLDKLNKGKPKIAIEFEK